MTYQDEFDVARERGSHVQLKDFVGKTVLFKASEFIGVDRDDKGKVIVDSEGNAASGGVLTADYGRKDAVMFDMIVIDGDNGPEEHKDVLNFNGRVLGALRRRINKPYLGVVAWGEKVKGNHPLQIDPPSDAQLQMARDVLAGRTVAAATAPVDASDDPFAVKP